VNAKEKEGKKNKKAEGKKVVKIKMETRPTAWKVYLIC